MSAPRRRSVLGVASALLATAGLLAVPATARADSTTLFPNCPVDDPALSLCLASVGLSGTFTIGAVTVELPPGTSLQGGLEAGPSGLSFVPATDGKTLTTPAVSVPGGVLNSDELAGVLPGVTDIGVVVKLAGTPTFSLGSSIDVTLPLELDLKNSLLGDTCSIGTQANPVVLHLTTGTTSPPAGTAPISGELGQVGSGPSGSNAIEFANQKLVDNTFAVPGSSGCGPLALLDGAVDGKAALPSPAGKNLASLVMNTYVASAKDVAASTS